MTFILILIILNIVTIALIYNKKNRKEVLTIKVTDDNIYFLLNDDIYLYLDKINKDDVYTALKNYSSELAKRCKSITILDKDNFLSKKEIESILSL